MVPSPVITLIGKPGCHLCDDARQAITEVVGELGTDVRLEELSILDDERLRDRYAEEIPVVLINGKQHAMYRVDKPRLRDALN